MQIISARAHGCVDYLLVIWFAGAPMFFGLEGVAALVSYAAAAAIVALAVLTDYPAGPIKAIAFPDHVAADYLVAGVVTLAPWLFGSLNEDPAGVDFMLWSGLTLLLTAIMTNDHRENPPRIRPRRRIHHPVFRRRPAARAA